MDENEEKQAPPIIIIRKKGGHGAHHGGAWKVAYADFVTAMMAFFLVMWIMSQSDAVKKAVQGYFRDPVNFMKKTGQGTLDGGVSPMNTQIRKSEEGRKLGKTFERLTEAGRKIREALDKIPEIAKLKDFIEIELIPEGLRIELVEVSTNPDSSNFFGKGSAALKSNTQLILKAIANELGKLPNDIIVEGHTDRTPYSERNQYSNWELSADRANSARRHMESVGLRDGQIVEIRGYADKHLKLNDSPYDPRNRRIAIIVLNEEYRESYRSLADGD